MLTNTPGLLLSLVHQERQPNWLTVISRKAQAYAAAKDASLDHSNQ